jgi:uncharacterized protein (TIGR00369 family)
VTDDELVAFYNARLPTFLSLLGGRITAFDTAAQTCTFEFDIGTDYCHSVDIVQGGFVTAMLDAASTHALFGASGGNVTNVASLEIKTNYFEPTRAGRLRVLGRVVREGYRIAFMEGEVYDRDGTLTANASTVAKLTRKQ